MERVSHSIMIVNLYGTAPCMLTLDTAVVTAFIHGQC